MGGCYNTGLQQKVGKKWDRLVVCQLFATQLIGPCSKVYCVTRCVS